MKKTALFWILWLPALVCSAQRYTQEEFFLAKGCVDIQTGISIPVGDFVLSNNTLPAGYAQNGYHIKVNFNYDVLPYLGFALQYQYMQNPFNAGDLLSDIQQTQTSVKYNSYISDPWKLQGLSLGVYYPFKATKTTVDIHVMGGLFSGTLPESEENVTVPSANVTYNFKQIENQSSNFGYQAGIKVRYQLYKALIVSSAIEYTQTKIKFEHIDVIETSTRQAVRVPDYTQQFQIFNLSIGLGMQFN
jgi:opacity protein-like surface antigen